MVIVVFVLAAVVTAISITACTRAGPEEIDGVLTITAFGSGRSWVFFGEGATVVAVI